ncbi:MAG TPA: phosphotransferase, partial [Acidimicrobiia bacterium]|nr:phosphotransferase [Acidimicrobiia bacterium]
ISLARIGGRRRRGAICFRAAISGGGTTPAIVVTVTQVEEAGSSDRPVAPDPDVLSEAAVSLRSLLRVDAHDIEWVVGPRLVRPRSTLFRLEAHGGGSLLTQVYYKVATPLPPGSGKRRLRRREESRAGLARSTRLETTLARLVDGEDITFARSLAVDESRMITVTMAVPGVSLGRPWRHSLTRQRRSRLEIWLERAGRAARLVEECTQDEVVLDEESEAERWERRLRVIQPILPERTVAAVEKVWERLLDAALRDPDPAKYAHGDFSSTNLLVGEELGLIDLGWVARLSGFDCAHLCFRIEYDSPLPESVTARFVRAVEEGYGEADLRSRPAWMYYRLGMLLRVAAEYRGGWRATVTRLRRRALSEVERILGEAASG